MGGCGCASRYCCWAMPARRRRTRLADASRAMCRPRMLPPNCGTCAWQGQADGCECRHGATARGHSIHAAFTPQAGLTGTPSARHLSATAAMPAMRAEAPCPCSTSASGGSMSALTPRSRHSCRGAVCVWAGAAGGTWVLQAMWGMEVGVQGRAVQAGSVRMAHTCCHLEYWLIVAAMERRCGGGGGARPRCPPARRAWTASAAHPLWQGGPGTRGGAFHGHAGPAGGEGERSGLRTTNGNSRRQPGGGGTHSCHAEGPPCAALVLTPSSPIQARAAWPSCVCSWDARARRSRCEGEGCEGLRCACIFATRQTGRGECPQLRPPGSPPARRQFQPARSSRPDPARPPLTPGRPPQRPGSVREPQAARKHAMEFATL